MKIATEILNQLGGNKFLAMTGAYNLAAGENYLIMKLRRNKANATHLKITLNSLDLYDVEFFSMRKFEKTVKAEFNGVYNDMLVDIFEKTTGLYTKL